jgi:peroxiredoxin
MVKKLVVILLALLLVGTSLLGCAGGQTPRVGKPVPDFKLLSLDGKMTSLKDYRGKPVMLNFWATWCGPCRYEMPFFQQIWEAKSGEGLVILAVNIGENVTTVKEFMDEAGFAFPVLLDSNQDVSLKYNIRSIPSTFFIDASGVIQDIKIGAFLDETQVEDRLFKITE